ncbi:MAG: hypothetical protein K0V04_18695, partial [Deltaproteobacteria bacterium]|nr:hypothetical protein [Deltaproteobacteria bacterium]
MRGQRWLWGGMLLWAAGCVAHRGPWLSTTVADDAPDPAGVDLVLLGSMAPPDRGAQAMAARVEQVLDGSRPAVVLWLGDLAAAPLRTASRRALRRGPRCTLGPSDPWPSPAVEALMVATQGGRASASFAVPGVLDHRCGYDDAPEFNPDSRRVPGTHYVLQVYADGSVTERASCREGVCRVSPSDTSGPQPLVELVMVDLGPWLHPADDPAGRARDDERVRSLEAMLEAVA